MTPEVKTQCYIKFGSLTTCGFLEPVKFHKPILILRKNGLLPIGGSNNLSFYFYILCTGIMLSFLSVFIFIKKAAN